jgi:peptidoglycan hydrolase CwlO-like protein
MALSFEILLSLVSYLLYCDQTYIRNSVFRYRAARSTIDAYLQIKKQKENINDLQDTLKKYQDDLNDLQIKTKETEMELESLKSKFIEQVSFK